MLEIKIWLNGTAIKKINLFQKIIQTDRACKKIYSILEPKRLGRVVFICGFSNKKENMFLYISIIHFQFL